VAGYGPFVRNTEQAAEKDPYASLRSIASHQRTADVRLRSSIFRAPGLWIFLNSLQEAFFSELLGRDSPGVRKFPRWPVLDSGS
jgi:hypothetical protein